MLKSDAVAKRLAAIELATLSPPSPTAADTPPSEARPVLFSIDDLVRWRPLVVAYRWW